MFFAFVDRNKMCSDLHLGPRYRYSHGWYTADIVNLRQAPPLAVAHICIQEVIHTEFGPFFLEEFLLSSLSCKTYLLSKSRW